jgi:hypothetical protein
MNATADPSPTVLPARSTQTGVANTAVVNCNAINDWIGPRIAVDLNCWLAQACAAAEEWSRMLASSSQSGSGAPLGACAVDLHAPPRSGCARLTRCRFMWHQTATTTATIAWRRIGRVRIPHIVCERAARLGLCWIFPTFGIHYGGVQLAGVPVGTYLVHIIGKRPDDNAGRCTLS